MPSLKASARRIAFAIAMTFAALAPTSRLPAQAVMQPMLAEPSDLQIPFLAEAPVIDGALDPGEAALPAVPLPLFENRAGDAPPTSVTARLAYGASFFYLMIEAAQDRIRCRDRAYQNGDGIVLAFASPRDGDEATDEFQVLGFSPRESGRRTWQYAFTWYKDQDWVGFPPLAGARFAWSSRAGKALFEILVPWCAVAPYHPWFRSEIGLNIGYTQAMGAQGIIDYRLVPDPLLQYEVSPRLYRRARFAAPPAGRILTPGVSLEASHAAEGTPIMLRVASRGTGQSSLSLDLRQGKRTLRQSTVSVASSASPASVAVPVDTGGLAPGEYELEARDASGARQLMPFGILPAFDDSAMRAELAAAATALPPGSLSTLEFRLEEIERAMARLRPHAVGAALGSDLAALAGDFQALRRGEDPVAGERGIVRRAFRSKIDGTLQPYSIRPVPSPKPGRAYPAVVFLHGSASDDRGQLDGVKNLLPGFILVAPYARGTSHFYSTDEAQADIEEVLGDVQANYPVDSGRIFLAGFSMGGYGVYRTFLEHPGRYHGLIVLSGMPYAGPSSPDFRDPARLSIFRGMDLFVAHGTEDRNCPFAETENMVKLLREAGAHVQLAIQRGRGHQSPTLWTSIRMMGWLKRMARK